MNKKAIREASVIDLFCNKYSKINKRKAYLDPTAYRALIDELRKAFNNGRSSEEAVELIVDPDSPASTAVRFENNIYLKEPEDTEKIRAKAVKYVNEWYEKFEKDE